VNNPRLAVPQTNALRRRIALPPRPPFLRAWSDPGLCHGFVGRDGGVSRGPFASLNLSYWVGDNSRSVDVNWQRARMLMPRGMRFAQLNQAHGKAIHTVGLDYGGNPRPAADGLVTAAAGLALCVFTADCVPVLLADAEKGVIGALHAGWRGTLAGIAAAGIREMVGQGARPEAIRAALGPAIGPCCYEVDASLARQFERRIPHAGEHTRAGDRTDKAYLDLRGIISEQLADAGIERGAIQSVGPCTRCASERYFSRRAAAGSATGLQLSFIARIAS
jgi:purine-nucleoside/S-methyl-5'-thioadenosine phosphorylase / adenosine deaminase